MTRTREFVKQNHFQPTLQRMTSMEWLQCMPKQGERVGQFRIMCRLGYGGMGCVFKVYQKELETVRAIKILRPDSGSLFRDRFSTEAKITANLNHPNIIRLYNVYQWNETVPYIEMEYIEGSSLEQLLQERKTIPQVAALAMITIVCHALDYAQKRQFIINGTAVSGLIHRDIKPGNILVSKEGVIKISDFGLAGFEQTAASSKDLPMGSQPYIAPEGLQGAVMDVRSDIYSLGIVFYEMLCGTSPFPQTGFLGSDGIDAKIKGQYPSIGTRVPNLKKSIAYIIEKCLQKNPDKRFQNFKQLHYECETALEEITAMHPGDIVRSYSTNPKSLRLHSARHARKNSKPAVLAWGAVVLGLCLGFVLTGVCVKTYRAYKKVRPVVTRINSVDTSAVQQHQSIEKKAGVISSETPSRRTTEKPLQNPPVSKKEEEKAARTQPVLLPQQPTPVSLLQDGIEALQDQNYTKAIDRFNALSLQSLPAKTRDSLDLYLLESYIKNQTIRDAHLHALNRRIDDGYYYLLTALIHEYAGNFAEANRSFDKAVTTASLFNPYARNEAMVRRIEFLYRQYEKTKDNIIRIKTYNACNDFITAVCSQSSGSHETCANTLEIMKKLEGFNE